MPNPRAVHTFITPSQRAMLRRLQLLAARVQHPDFCGLYRSSFKGVGLDFSEIKPFEVGDDVRFIDWNVTARTGRPHVRVYTEERSIRIAYALDLSSTMAAPGIGRPKLEVAREVMAALSIAALSGGDRIGWSTFARSVIHRAPVRGTRRALWHMLEELSHLTCNDEPADYIAGLQGIALHHQRRSVILLLSDFLLSPEHTDPAPLIAMLRAVQRRHEVIVLAINDPLEWELVDNGLVWASPHDSRAQPVILDTSSNAVRRQYAKRGRHIRLLRRHIWQKAGIDFAELSTTEDTVKSLLALFRRRTSRPSKHWRFSPGRDRAAAEEKR